MSAAFSKQSACYGLTMGEFDHLDSATKRKLITLMARISEKSYRRGFQQGNNQNRPVIVDIFKWRFETTLDKCVSPHFKGWDMPTTERLFAECPELHNVGLIEMGEQS